MERQFIASCVAGGVIVIAVCVHVVYIGNMRVLTFAWAFLTRSKPSHTAPPPLPPLPTKENNVTHTASASIQPTYTLSKLHLWSGPRGAAPQTHTLSHWRMLHCCKKEAPLID